MMLTVHGLPNKTKFQDVEVLIKQECNIPDFILDNLVDDGYDSKKVRIGLTNENDGYRLMKCLEGFRMSGSHVLKVVPVGKQQTFEPRSSYSNQPRNDYPNLHPDYSRQNDYQGQSNIINPSYSSPGGPARIEPDTRHHDRGLMDARQSLSQAMGDSRGSDRYQGSLERRQGQDTRGPDPRTDFRDPSRSLAPHSVRPAALDARGSALDTGGLHGSMRGQDSHNYRGTGDHRHGSNPEPVNRQPQWAPTGGNEQWHAPARPVSSQNTGYNYQQPQVNSGYGQQQPNISPQSGYPPSRAPEAQGYQQSKIAPPDRVASRPHVLRSVEIVDAPIQPREQPIYTPQQKPITIMKDNFQGPTQYNVTGQVPQSQGAYQGQGPNQAWGQQGQGTKQLTYDKSYDERRLAMEKPLAKPAPTSQEYAKRRFSPPRSGRPASPGRRSPPRNLPTNTVRPSETYSQLRASPTRQYDRNVAPTAAGYTPANRQMSPSKTMTGRRNSPIRKTSPNRRRDSPSGQRISPFARKISPGRRISPSKKRATSPGKISPGRRISPFARNISPSGRRISPTGRRVSPTGRRVSPTGRRVSPTGRRVSPTGRRISPTGRRVSPTGRRVSPTGRRVSPTGRRVSPTGRRVSPTGRRVSPTGRRVSPTGRRLSPHGKREEPRRMSPSMMKYDYYVEDERRMGGGPESPRRYSPKRSPPRGSGRYSPSEMKYEENILGSKDAKPIRPAYEIKAQKYTGGFRPNETQHSAAGARNEPKISSWQIDKTTYPLKKEDRDTRMGRPDPIKKKLSPRRSRSRSPVKDRNRRHSPSPLSPRRSWALEKRQTPEPIRSPPPPPLWPGQDTANKPKHPVWERNNPEQDRRFDDKRRTIEEKYTPRFSPRRDDHLEYRDEMKFVSDYSPEDRTDYRSESPHRDAKLFKEVDKDFNDIYQRAVEFRRKTEELRKSNDHRNRTYDDESSKRKNTPPRADRPDKTKPNWIPIKIQTKELCRDRTKLRLEPAVKEKRDKAVEEIANRILDPHNFTGEQRQRVLDELQLSIYNIMLEMFSDKDVSYIELVIKFRARYDAKDEEKILLDVLTSMPSHYKNSLKRKGEGITEVVPKISRSSTTYGRPETTRPKLADAIIPDWNLSLEPPKVLSMPLPHVVPPVINTAPVMVQPSVYLPPYQVPPQMYQSSLQADMQSSMQSLQTHIQANLQSHMQPDFESNMQEIQSRMQSHIQSKMQLEMQSNVEPITHDQEEGYNLYLCQDDFEPFTENQAEKLRAFLVSEMFKASETGDGWAPDFAFKGLHSQFRYELSTKDEMSKNWILNLDFSDFEFFNVLVYTKEELWYERAAVWLPGHSRYRNIEPLEKLRLQNQYADGINIGKWKFVKKIVTAKGTRLYVDMPPSSARALEKKKMMLSYELGKVNVYLKAVAVDKEVFDAGLKAFSITDPSQLASAVQSSVMPTIPSKQVGLVMVTLNGAKSLTIEQAGKIKEMMLYNLFKYHQQEGRSKTDFLKFGFCPPNAIGIVPENNESKKWLMSRYFGKLQRQAIVVLDGEDANTKYFRMRAALKNINLPQNTQTMMERLRTSNRGVKGLNFHFWKPVGFSHGRNTSALEVDVDLESAETLIRLNFKLDYVNDDHATFTVYFKSDYSQSKLEEKIRKYKAEQVDSYDVANMDIDSD